MTMSVKHWQDPLNLILGLWMLVSPWALQYELENYPTWNAVVVGIVIAAAALSALFQVKAWEEWTNVVLGLWLMMSPSVLLFDALMPAMANAVIVGAIVAGLALWELGTDKDIGGWWRQTS